MKFIISALVALSATVAFADGFHSGEAVNWHRGSRAWPVPAADGSCPGDLINVFGHCLVPAYWDGSAKTWPTPAADGSCPGGLINVYGYCMVPASSGPAFDQPCLDSRY